MIDSVGAKSVIHSADRSGFKIPAGIYWVGDPACVLDDDTWTALMDLDKNNGSVAGIIDGHIVVALNALYGDGEYVDEKKFAYTVDSGYIGLIPIEYIQLNEELLNIDAEYFMKNHGRVVSFSEPTDIYVNSHGVMNFSKFVVNTGDPELEFENFNDITEENMKELR